MKIFIAGVMQGNRQDKKIYSQDYRSQITNILESTFKNIEVIDPDKTDPDRLTYSTDQASEMFFRYCKVASEIDLLISYLPEASMGSAIEMWNAHQAAIPVLTISPLKHNWVVKLLSSAVFGSMEEFGDALRNKDFIQTYLEGIEK